jgi:hypothetical protein
LRGYPASGQLGQACAAVTDAIARPQPPLVQVCCGSRSGLCQQLRAALQTTQKPLLGYREGYGYTDAAAQAFNSKAYARSSRPAGGAIYPFRAV